MFERRLRVFLALLFLGGLILAARAAQVQVAQGDEWRDRSDRAAERVAYLSPRRGDIVDCRGVVLATDVPAFEACVNYRAVPTEPDAKWLDAEATRRAKKLPAWKGGDKAARAALTKQESAGVLRDLDAMWALLARLSNQDRAQIDAIRDEVRRDVEGKHDAYWQARYRKATDEFAKAPPSPWYERWITGGRGAPTPEQFQSDPIGEQLAFHPIVPDVSQAVYNELKLAQDWLPQYKPDGGASRSVLELRSAVRRSYPKGDVACHVIGHVGPVSREDREDDPERADPQRRYALIDRIGREGLEKLAERQLRGTRGEQRTDRAGVHLATEKSEPGKTVRTTIDVALQAEIQRAFESVDFIGPFNPQDKEVHREREHFPMNGAAVVIDLASGEVRALVSVPTYDLNKFDELYEKMYADDLNRPMRNRALQDAVEPGSTAKPIIGLGAVTQGKTTTSDRIECNGRPVIDGKPIAAPRCWTLSMYPNAEQHHAMPPSARHPTGFLDLTDAIERSCNVYFVTEGDKLGIDGVSHWMREFGYGSETGIGLPENRGLVPSDARVPAAERVSAAWFASIGQGKVNATPIQVANEMATIARDGIWLRPRLVPAGSAVPLPTTRPDGSAIEDRRDLHLDPGALAAVHAGMERVVNSPGGTGTAILKTGPRPADVVDLGVHIAAKTGSATASQLTRPMRDADGRLIYGANNRPRSEFIAYGWRDALNPLIPWYRASGMYQRTVRGTKVEVAGGTHSWVGGYAPAHDPKIAFAVYVEYGNSGGVAAGSVVKKLIAACVKEGYVPSSSIAPSPTRELLQRVDDPPMTEEPSGAPEEPD